MSLIEISTDVRNPQNGEASHFKIEMPDKCVFDGKTMTPKFIGSSSVLSASNGAVDEYQTGLVFETTDCHQLFIQSAKITVYIGERNMKIGLIKNIREPFIEVPQSIEEMRIVSENFVKTYKQSIQARKAGLDEIAGMGLGKSLEYLVKDYAKKRYPDDSKEIDNNWMSNIIKNDSYYPESLFPSMRKLLDKAKILRNDETHTQRDYPDYDFKDLNKAITQVTLLIAANQNADDDLE
jgi:hypothetical protein